MTIDPVDPNGITTHQFRGSDLRLQGLQVWFPPLLGPAASRRPRPACDGRRSARRGQGIAGAAAAWQKVAIGIVLFLAAEVVAEAARIPPEEASAHAGKAVIVEGRVESVVCSPMACVIAFGAGFSGLLARVPSAALGRFPPLRETFVGRLVRISGVVQVQDGKPRIDLEDPSAIVNAEESDADPRQPEARAPVAPASPVGSDGSRAEPPPSQPESKKGDEIDHPVLPAGPARGVAPSMGGVDPEERRLRDQLASQATSGPPRIFASTAARERDRIRSLADSLRTQAAADDDARARERSAAEEDPLPETAAQILDEIRALRQEMASLARDIEQVAERVSDVERTLSPEGIALPPEAVQIPPNVVAESRPLSLRRVAAGWPAERVKRMLGEPVAVSGSTGGYTTWDYGGGYAVTLDERGRVVSTSGY